MPSQNEYVLKGSRMYLPRCASCTSTQKSIRQWTVRTKIIDSKTRRIRTLHKTRRRRKSGAASSVRPAGQEVSRPNSADQLLFMHSARVLFASSLLMPLVFSLHIAILLFAFSGLADRQLFMKALRSSPFLSAAWSLHIFILSCCDIFASVLVSAAYALPQARSAAAASARNRF